MWTTLSCKLQGQPPILLCFTSRSSIRSSLWILEKNPLEPLAAEGEKESCEVCQGSVLFWTRFVHKGTILLEPKLWGFPQSLINITGRRKIYNSSHPVPHKWINQNKQKTNWDALGKFTVQGTSSPKNLDVILGPRTPPLPHANHHTTKDLFTTFLFTWHLSSGYQEKKSQGIRRGKKHSLRRLKKHQNLTQIWQKYWNNQTKNLKTFWLVH